MKSRPYSVAFLLALLVFGFAGTSGAASKSDKGPSSPAIDAFYVDPSNQVSAGTELTFTVEGTPKGQASVKLSGIPKTIPLKEVDRGTYEGSYTIRSRDRLGTNPTVRATLRARGRATTTELALAGGAAPAAAAPATPAAAAPATPAATAPAAPPKIERFTMAPVSKMEPGADLRFSLSGTPGAKASFSIERVVRDAPMREVKSGQYEGRYTIRQRDNFSSTLNAVGTLESGGQSVGMRLEQALAGQPVAGQPVGGQQPAAAGLPLQITSHANNEQVKAGATEVRGRTAPGAKVDVQVNAGLFGINQQISSQSVVADASGNFAFSFKPPVNVPGARYDIVIKASNQQMTKDMQLVLFQAK